MKCMVQSTIKTVLSAALAAAACAAWAPGAIADDNGNTQAQPQQNVNQQSFVANGEKHYWMNGQEFAMNIGTGERREVTNATYSGSTQEHNSNPQLSTDDQQNPKQQSFVANGEKHYWWNGQEYAMNIATGERRQISYTGTFSHSSQNHSNNTQPGAYQQQRISQQSYVSHGDKHYFVNGQEYAMNIATGERREINR
jgi:uncharacterized Zn-binding protein involved in type VI secretion